MQSGHHLGPGATLQTVSVVDQSKKGVTKLSDEAEGSDEAGTHA